MDAKNQTLKEGLIEYFINNPEQRFWQAIRNYSKYNFVLVSDTLDLDTNEFKNVEDTFYKEGR